jgi:hypothetical protein
VGQWGVSAKADEFSYSSTTVPDTALFIAADEPLLVFPSATAAEQYLETIDVEDGVYSAAYGPRGEPYSIRTFDGRVVLEATGEPEKPDELRALLLRYLNSCGRKAEVSASVEALVSEVWKVESDFWQEHDPFGDRFGARIPVWGCLAFVLILAVTIYLVLR